MISPLTPLFWISLWRLALAPLRRGLFRGGQNQHRNWAIVIAFVVIGYGALLFSWTLLQPIDEHPTRIARKDYRPDLRECPEESELWECIRHAQWR